MYIHVYIYYIHFDLAMMPKGTLKLGQAWARLASPGHAWPGQAGPGLA